VTDASISVVPAQAGIQGFSFLDPGLRRDDDEQDFYSFPSAAIFM
jgi:hypothetical protein